jgi:F0F1-type ATP synthase assembly protein I
MTSADQGVAFAATLAVEIFIVMLATVRWPASPVLRLAAAVLPSCFTHPLAWRAIGNFGAHDYAAGLCLVEAIVILVEAVCLRLVLKLSVPRSLLLSFTANAASGAAGWLIF